VLRIGQTFVNRAASDGSVLSHLWIIVSDPAKDENAVIANLTTMDPGTTDPCVVKPADHPFISRASVIAYDYVKIRPCNGIEKLAACGMLSPSRDLSPALLARVQGAIGASPIVANEVKDMLRAQGFI
jgi:hypothetical protein